MPGKKLFGLHFFKRSGVGFRCPPSGTRPLRRKVYAGKRGKESRGDVQQPLFSYDNFAPYICNTW
jgi:hypothetical protein